MKKEDGPSFLNSLRDKFQQRRQQNQANNAPRPNGIFNPFSNGTGSGRPNFSQVTQSVLGRITGGMGLGKSMGGFGTGGNQANLAANQLAASAPLTPEQAAQQQEANAALMNTDMGGAPMGVKPKKMAKVQAKEYAKKHGIRGKAKREMVKEAKKSRSFDAETNTQAKGNEAASKEVDFGGASMNGGPGGRKKPTANTMKSESTSYMNNRTDINQMKGYSAGIERRPASVDFPNQSASSNRDLDFARMMNRDNAEMWAKGGGGIYSDKYAKQRLHDSGYDMVSRPGPLNPNYGKTYKLPTEETKLKPAKPQSEMKMLRSVKGIEPKKKLMATKTKAKAKAPLKKMTPRPAKKL